MISIAAVATAAWTTGASLIRAYVTGLTSADWNTNSGDMWGGSTGGLQVVDLSDPSSPKSVATWHYPGQLASEVEARSKWSSVNDRPRMATLHGPEYVPLRVEDGGKLGYGPWGSLGMMIHDLSDPAHPKLVSRWEPDHYTSLAWLALPSTRSTLPGSIGASTPLRPQAVALGNMAEMIKTSGGKVVTGDVALRLARPGAFHRRFEGGMQDIIEPASRRK